MKIEDVSRKFLTFAEKECKGSSPLYEYLSLQIAKDESLLEICLNAKDGQPIPNLFFGAVHYLLLLGTNHQLKNYYPSFVSSPQPHHDSYQPFKDFCNKNKRQIEEILKTRIVQTNEVRRCAYLYPVFCYIHSKTKKPLALIEIGTSAGLQLLWDQYSYSYGQNEVFGNKDSRLTLISEIKGENRPPLCPTPPPVSTRIGIDLNPVDLTNEEERLWLKSLIWPEHKERRTMFENASNCVKENPVHLIAGDGLALISVYVAKIPDDSVICIFHTHVANQMTVEMRKALLKTVEAIGKKRDVFHVYNNIQDRFLHLDYYVDGIESKQTVAETDGHGRWFTWVLENH